jgi:hypothetical protein
VAALRHDHRQTCQPRRGKAGGHAQHRASPAQGGKQLSGEFAPADPPPRVTNEAVQIGRSGAALSLSPRALTARRLIASCGPPHSGGQWQSSAHDGDSHSRLWQRS